MTSNSCALSLDPKPRQDGSERLEPSKWRDWVKAKFRSFNLAGARLTLNPRPCPRFQILDRLTLPRTSQTSCQDDPEPLDPAKWRDWVKVKFRSFNSALEGVYTQQSGWTIPDPKLLASVRRVILQVSGDGTW